MNRRGQQGFNATPEETERAGGFFIVLSAPSGTGKTSICREFMKLCPDIRFSVSYTTRPPRPGEKEGVDYHFISPSSFRERIKEGVFAEWTENYGHLYGTSIRIMDRFVRKGAHLLLDLEPGGAKALKMNYPGGVYVFVLPPSLDDLKNRLKKRGESPDVIRKRLNKAMDEIQEVIWYDYVILNEEIERAIDCLRSIYVAEKSRRERLKDRLEKFLIR